MRFNPIIIKKGTTYPTSGDWKVRFIDPINGVFNEQWVMDGDDAILPPTPSHTLLTFLEYNNSHQNITHDIDLGAVFETTDNKTYFFCRFNALTGLQPTLYLNKATTASMTIDWGDGSTSTSTSSGNVSFAKSAPYATAGDYTITIECTANYNFYTSIFSGTAYLASFLKIYTSKYVTSLGQSSCNSMSSLNAISLSNSISSIGNYSFVACYSLITQIIPKSVTSIAIDVWEGCRSLRNFVFALETNQTVGAFCFQVCQALIDVILPNLTIIDQNFFYQNLSNRKIIIPSTITSLGASCFNTNTACLDYQFLPTTPPTITTTTFNLIPKTAKIYVPDASVTAYKTATNWSTYASYIYPISTRP